MADQDTHYNRAVNGNAENGNNGSMMPDTMEQPSMNDDYTAAPAVPNYGLTTPIAPEGGNPVYDTDQNSGNNYPNRPGGGQQNQNPWLPTPSLPSTPQIPTFPIYPSFPSTGIPQQSYGKVRFLNASTNSFPVNISIDNASYAINSRFGTASNYDWISDGFHTVTVRRATGLRSILLQQTFPFVASEKFTMVLTDSAAGGLEMIQISDTGCSNLPYNSGCYRFANMSYSGSRYDLLLYGGDTIFRGVSYQNVTSYKQAVSGTYQFYVSPSANYSVVNELPIIVIGAISGNANMMNPIVSFEVSITAGRNYTSYIIGNTWSSDTSIRVITLEDE